MQRNQKNGLGRLRRVHDFLERVKPNVALGSVENAVAGMAEIIAKLEAAAVEQESKTRSAMIGTRHMTRQVVSVRQELMRPVVRMARPIFQGDRQLLSAMKLSRALDPERVAASALGLADSIEPHTKELIDAGFPPGFVEKLRTAALELRQALDDRAADFARRLGATKATRHADSQGRRIIRVLDAMVAPALASDPERLREWQGLVHLTRHPVMEQLAEADPTQASAPSLPASSPQPTLTAGVASSNDATASQRVPIATEPRAA